MFGSTHSLTHYLLDLIYLSKSEWPSTGQSYESTHKLLIPSLYQTFSPQVSTQCDLSVAIN